MKTYVLDTSAIITLREDEKGADQVAELFVKANRNQASVFISFMTYMELYYNVYRLEGKIGAEQACLELKRLPAVRIDFEEPLLFLAGAVKATSPMSVGDSWIAATALHKKAILVHKDPEFEALQDRLEMIILPYKK